jgi:hypothetical protein
LLRSAPRNEPRKRAEKTSLSLVAAIAYTKSKYIIAVACSAGDARSREMRTPLNVAVGAILALSPATPRVEVEMIVEVE